jgi:hypothetical protein
VILALPLIIARAPLDHIRREIKTDHRYAEDAGVVTIDLVVVP